MQIKVTTRGLDDYQKRMSRLPLVLKQRIDAALKQNAEELAAMARRNVPVGDSGDLKASIRVEPLVGQLGYRVLAGNKTAFYVRWVEFGTSSGTDATNFFFGSLRGLKPRLKGRVTRAINKALKETQ